MVSVYVLRSLKSGKHYIGMSKDPKQRLSQHNRGKTSFTKGHIPWELIYTEPFPDLASAREMEKYYKTSRGREKLKKTLMSKGKSW